MISKGKDCGKNRIGSCFQCTKFIMMIHQNVHAYTSVWILGFLIAIGKMVPVTRLYDDAMCSYRCGLSDTYGFKKEEFICDFTKRTHMLPTYIK